MVGAALVRRLAREDCEILDRAAREVDLRRPGRGRAWVEPTQARRRCSSPRRRSAASSPTTRCRPNSSTTIWRSRPMSSTALAPAGVEKLLFLGSSCIYPRLAPQPMTRGRAAHRAARADQRMVRGRQDRRHQAVPGLSPAIWLRFHLGHADQSLRPRRQFRPRKQPCAAGADPQALPRGEARPGARASTSGAPARRGANSSSVDDLADAWSS